MNREAPITTIYIVRHGESVGNLNHIVSGHTDHDLTLFGVKQAIELGKRFRNITFDKVFSSDLTRARKTAELIVAGRNLTIATTEKLRELYFGDLEGKPTSEFHTLFDSWNKLSYKARLKQRQAWNIESEESVKNRFITYLYEIATSYPGQTLLVSTHGAVMHSVPVHLGRATYQEIKKINNTAWILVKSNGTYLRIENMEGVVTEREIKSNNN